MAGAGAEAGAEAPAGRDIVDGSESDDDGTEQIVREIADRAVLTVETLQPRPVPEVQHKVGLEGEEEMDINKAGPSQAPEPETEKTPRKRGDSERDTMLKNEYILNARRSLMDEFNILGENGSPSVFLQSTAESSP